MIPVKRQILTFIAFLWHLTNVLLPRCFFCHEHTTEKIFFLRFFLEMNDGTENTLTIVENPINVVFDALNVGEGQLAPELDIVFRFAVYDNDPHHKATLLTWPTDLV